MDDDGPPGVPEWVVTYGDMMSLLLTFFIMLVSLSEVKADKKYRAILEAARQHLGYAGGPPAPPGKQFPMNSLVESLEEMKLGSQADTEKGTGGVRQKGPQGQDIRVMRLKDGDSHLAGQAIVFSPGDARLSFEMEAELRSIAREVAGKPQKLEIRSFTSAVVDGDLQTPDQRMELAFVRAELVRQRLVDMRIKRDHMRIAVYFHTPESSAEQNLTLSEDRVEVTILNAFASEYVGHEEDYR